MQKHRGVRCLLAGLLAAVLSLPAQATVSQSSQAAQRAFDSLVKSYYPLTPNQVHKFKTIAAEQQKANAMPPGPAPAEGTSNIVPVSLTAGQAAPLMRVGQGTITSLVFTDATGASWPIVAYNIGNPKLFDVAWQKDSAILMIQGHALYGQSNIAVILQGLDTPVMLTLLLGQKQWDYLNRVRVQALKSADAKGKARQVAQAPKYLIDLLTGVAPKGAKKMLTTDSAVQVWSYKNHYLMLTPATLMSPAWMAKQSGSSPDKQNAYELPVAPYIMVSLNGKMARVKVSAPKVSSKDGTL